MVTKNLGIESTQLLLLLNWMSPAFPIGAYAYSHGLEWAIEAGEVTTREDVEEWIADVTTRGSGWNDAVLFALSYEQDVNGLALALCSSKERHLETTQLGEAFGKAAFIFLSDHQRDLISRFATASPKEKREESNRVSPFSFGEGGSRGTRETDEVPLAYPVSAARACKAMGIDCNYALLAFLQGFSNALISVAVRLVPIGQTSGLEIMRNLMPIISETATRASRATLGDLGSVTLLSDVAAMKHEEQHSRIFRT